MAAIHVSISEELHKKVRMHCASIRGLTISKFIEELIEKELKNKK